jgi:hypothetical protein
MRTPDEHCYSWWLPTSKSQTSRYGVGNTFLFISFVNAWIFKQSQRSESSFRVVFRDKKCRLMMSLKFFQLRYGVGNTFLFISFVNAWIFKQSQRSKSSFLIGFRDKKCRSMSLKFFQLRYGVGNTFLFILFVNAWNF